MARLLGTYRDGLTFGDVQRWAGFWGRREVARLLGSYRDGLDFGDVQRWPG